MTLLQTNNFPEFTGRCCPAPCEVSKFNRFLCFLTALPPICCYYCDTDSILCDCDMSSLLFTVAILSRFIPVMFGLHIYSYIFFLLRVPVLHTRIVTLWQQILNIIMHFDNCL